MLQILRCAAPKSIVSQQPDISVMFCCIDNFSTITAITARCIDSFSTITAITARCIDGFSTITTITARGIDGFSTITAITARGIGNLGIALFFLHKKIIIKI